jgi:hypothetical protein
MPFRRTDLFLGTPVAVDQDMEVVVAGAVFAGSLGAAWLLQKVALSAILRLMTGNGPGASGNH